ncbi:MAG: polymerase subunit delta [Acidimicrobiaceae bacterium]
MASDTVTAIAEPTIDPWAGIVGQDFAVSQLKAAAPRPIHAYLLVGPRGSGKRQLARAFAATLLAATTKDDPDRAVRLALGGRHPDLHEFERAGPYITVEQADAIIRESSRSGVESDRKVLVLVDFHLVQAAVEGKLLKSIEEPPGDSVFIVLAESVPTLLEPIASRCVRIEVDPLTDAMVASALVSSGVTTDVAEEVAIAARGDLERARLLATDPRFSLRRARWRSIPEQLDDSGAVVARLVGEVRAMIDDAAAPVQERHADEIVELEARIERYGERGSGKTQLVERHRRELRRHRTDEIRFGLATMAARYRDELTVQPRLAIDAIDAIEDSHTAMERNPNETLLLHALLLRLPAIGTAVPA